MTELTVGNPRKLDVIVSTEKLYIPTRDGLAFEFEDEYTIRNTFLSNGVHHNISEAAQYLLDPSETIKKEHHVNTKVVLEFTAILNGKGKKKHIITLNIENKYQRRVFLEDVSRLYFVGINIDKLDLLKFNKGIKIFGIYKETKNWSKNGNKSEHDVAFGSAIKDRGLAQFLEIIESVKEEYGEDPTINGRKHLVDFYSENFNFRPF